MIRLEAVDLTVKIGPQKIPLLQRADFTFDASRTAVLSRDAKARSALMMLLSGAIMPQRGRLVRRGRVSWPIGQTGMFRGHLDGWSLISFLCDLYQRPLRASRALIADLMDDPDVMSHPMIRWPRQSQVQFAYAAALVPRFDIYLVDGAVRLPYPRFAAEWEAAFTARVSRRQLIVSTAQSACLEALAPLAVEVDAGRLAVIPDLLDHLRRHRQAIDDLPGSETAGQQESDQDAFGF